MNQIRNVTVGALLAGGLLAAAGLSPPPAGAVVDGERVAIADAPWAVSLETQSKGRWTHACSATAIAPRRLLTARHCVEHNDVWQRTVVAGSDDPTRTAARRTTTVARVWVPVLLDFDRPGAKLNRGDLAVVETRGEIGAPALPLSAADTALAAEEPVWAYGFGFTTLDYARQRGPALLRRAFMRLHTPAQCGESDFGDEPTALCGHRGEGAAGGILANGDSGGGLVRLGAAGPELLGVNSAATHGELSDTLSGFASVPALHAFVTDPARGFELPTPLGRPAIRGTARVGKRVRCAARFSRPVRRVQVAWQLTRRGSRPLLFTSGAKPWKVPAAARGRTLACRATGGLTEMYGSTTELSRTTEVTR